MMPGRNQTAAMARTPKRKIRVPNATVIRCSADAKAELYQKRYDFFQWIEEFAEQNKMTTSFVRRKLGFSTMVGRARSASARWQRYYAKTQANPNPESAQKRLNQFYKKAVRFCASADHNEGIFAFVVAAHPHTNTNSVVAGHKVVLNHMETALKQTQSLANFRRQYHAEVHKDPPKSATVPVGGAEGTADRHGLPGSNSEDPESDRWTTVKKCCPPAILRAIQRTFETHGRDTKDIRLATNNFKRITYVGVFDRLMDAGLCVTGWPAAAKCLLMPDAEYTDDGDKETEGASDQEAIPTITITSGSLMHWNKWSKTPGRKVWLAMCRGTLKIELAP
ncbi:hypothetical protein V8E36_008858 [Tilletia maclaganii]